MDSWDVEINKRMSQRDFEREIFAFPLTAEQAVLERRLLDDPLAYNMAGWLRTLTSEEKLLLEQLINRDRELYSREQEESTQACRLPGCWGRVPVSRKSGECNRCQGIGELGASLFETFYRNIDRKYPGEIRRPR